MKISQCSHLFPLLLAALALVPQAQSADLIWNTTTGTWDTTTANWTGDSTIWTNGDTAIFSGDTAYTVTVASGITQAGIEINGSGNKVLNGAAIGGTGGIVKNGTGILYLDAENTFTGDTTINGGRIVVRNNGRPVAASVDSTLTVNTGGILEFARNNTWGVHTATTLPKVIINAGGVATSSTYFTVLGDIEINGGTLTATGGANANFRSYGLKGTVSVTGNSTISATGTYGGIHLGSADVNGTTFDVATGGSLTISASIYNGRNAANTAFQTSAFTKDGAGTLTLTAANTFTGLTTVSNGTLIANHGNALGTGDIIVGANGTLQLGSTAGVELSGVTSLSVLGRLVFTGTNSKIILSGDYILIGAVFDLNNLYNAVGTYELFDLGGTGSGTVSFVNVDSGFNYSFDQGVLTVALIPEPSTYALLGALGSAGLLLTRRRRP